MPGGRVLYFSHDNPLPSGGVRTIATHVRILNRNGIPAFVVYRTPGFRPSWFAEDVPVLYYSPGLPMSPEDIAIVPEDHLPLMRHLKDFQGRKVVFCQNHFYILQGVADHPNWHDLGISQVMACSDVIAEFLATYLSWPQVPVVHCSIDPDRFRPAAKKLQIAVMPRKAKGDAGFIHGLVSLAPWAKEVSWSVIEDMTEGQTAQVMAESAIFLSLSRREGFGLPPLEAMACGCVVVGYHGQGGLQYATAKNGFWSEEGNPLAAAEMLKRVVEMVRGQSPEIPTVIEAARQTAAAYSPARQEQELLKFIRGVTSR